MGEHRAPGHGLDDEVEAGRDTHRPQQPQGVLLEAKVGVAHGADEPCFEVALTVGGVDQAGAGLRRRDGPRRWR